MTTDHEAQIVRQKLICDSCRSFIILRHDAETRPSIEMKQEDIERTRLLLGPYTSDEMITSVVAGALSAARADERKECADALIGYAATAGAGGDVKAQAVAVILAKAIRARGATDPSAFTAGTVPARG